MIPAKVTAGAAMLLAAVSLAACNPPNSGDRVSASQAQAAQSVAFGTVIAARPVTVAGGNAPASVVGTIAGGVAGGLLGNQIGGGTGKVIATGVGATAGAAAGNRVANAATQQASTEYTIRTDGGQTVAVIQASPSFGIGERVQVISGRGTTRLAPA